MPRQATDNSPSPPGRSSTDDDVTRSLGGWSSVIPKRTLAAFEAAVRIEQLALRGRQDVAQLTTEANVGSGDADVLGTLFSSGPPYALQPKDLAERCFVTSGAMTGRLDRLEKAGLVVRIRSNEDRRSVDVQLTKKGHDLAVAIALKVHKAGFSSALLALGEQDLATLNELLKRTEALARKADSRG
jgi:DNA-binding MarR family transcriptional regulator